MHRHVLTPLVAIGIICLFTNSSCHKASLSATQDGNWVQAAAIPFYPRGYATSFVIGDTAYVGLGVSGKVGGTGRLNDFYCFSLDSGWSQRADFPGRPRSKAASFTIGNYGFVGTGTDDDVNGFNDFYRYDPVANEWLPRAVFPGTPRFEAVGFAVGGKGYIGTGQGPFWMNDFYQYDADQDKWARTPGTAGNFSKRSGAVSFVYKDKAYIVTGQISGGMAKDFWSFDPSQSQPWTQLADIANTDPSTVDDQYGDIQRQYATAFINNGKAYLTLGENGSLSSNTWMYDLDAKVWNRRTAYKRAPRLGAVSFTVKGRSFVGSGATTNLSAFDDFDEFLPNIPYNPNN